MKAIVVIPTFNEAENAEKLISKIHSVMPDLHILIVDDNSPDGTSKIVARIAETDDRVHLIIRMKKMGLGTAYCAGFKWALDQGYEVIFEMDADFSHNPEDLPIMLKELDDCDLVIGSRYKSGINVVNWPLRRLILSYGANAYSRYITGMKINDATGGFKCFRADALRMIDLSKVKTNGYGFQIEMNYRLWRKGARIKEVSIIFIDRRSGVSKMNKKIIYEAIFLVWKMKFASIFHTHEFD